MIQICGILQTIRLKDSFQIQTRSHEIWADLNNIQCACAWDSHLVSLSWFQLLNWTWTWFQTLIHQIRADLNMLYTFGRGPVSGPTCPPGTYTKAAYQCCQHATGFKLFRSTRFGGNPSYLAETIIQQGVCSCPKEDRRIKTAGYEHFAGLGRAR